MVALEECIAWEAEAVYLSWWYEAIYDNFEEMAV